MDGPFQLGTGFRFVDFTDGLSNTFLAGDKHVPLSRLGAGWWDCSLYNGDYHTCSSRAVSRTRRLTTNPYEPAPLFGSMHTGVVQFVFGDGHVQAIPETIDPYVLEWLGSRKDGNVIPGF